MAYSRPRLASLLATTLLSLAMVASLAACSQPAPAPTAAPTKAAAAPAAAPAAATTAPTAAQPTAATKAATAVATVAPTAPAKTGSGYPTRSITVVIPFAAGGGLDIGARVLAGYLEKELGQPVQVVNKAGATGQIGWTEVAAAKPDGYTLTFFSSPNTESTYLDPERKAAYTRASFAAIANQVYDPNTYTVLASSPYKTFADLLKAAKDKPESVTTGDGGLMSDDHLSLLSVQKKAGVKFNMTHFDGGGAVQTALHGGHVQVMIGNIGDAMSGYKSGQFRVLAISSEKRSPLLPEAPTLKEQNVDVVTAVARGLVAPAGTPAEVIKTLEAAIKKVDGMKDYQEKMATSGLPTLFMSAEEYDKYLKAEEERVGQLLKELK